MTNYVVSPIKRHLSYAFECDSIVQRLHDEVVKLKKLKDGLQQYVIEATRNGVHIFESITNWLSTAENHIEEAEKLIRMAKREKKFFFRFCPNFKASFQLGKEANRKVEAILHLSGPEEHVSFQPQTCRSRIELLPSRVLMLNKIMDALSDPGLNTIGIYGREGVGKTTLAKEVCARARDAELFDHVIIIFVSRFPDLRRIQLEIAGFLGLKFDAEEVPRRARQLYQRLRKAKLLIILDDVWKKLDLHALGIPLGDECKLIVCSRRKDVLSSEMGSQKDFFVDVLSGEESWSLFQNNVPMVYLRRFSAIANRIAKNCAGLPLLIILVSSHLRDHEQLVAWVDMLNRLSMFRNDDVHERVRTVLESSFEDLPGQELKSLFLLCASFAQSNIQIQLLLIYGMGLHLFCYVGTIAEARSRLFSLIDRLKYKGLLLDGDLYGHVKLHDVVRDASISICQNSFIDWPNENYTIISLPIRRMQDPPAGLLCPEAKLFLLSSEDLCVEIPDLSFERIANLKAVGFTGIGFSTRLPSSLGCLRNLNTLCLHRCRLDDISVIGVLTELEFLSFADSGILQLPREIEALTQLKLLDLTNCSKLREIPLNVISKLISLRELYMCNSYVRWDEEGNVSLVELEKLSHLSSLEIQIVNPKPIQKFSSFYNELRHYKIIIGEEQGCWENYERSRMLRLIKLEASIYLKDTLKVLLRGIEDLYLEEMNGMGSVLDDLTEEGFPQLRHLCIKNDYSIQHLIKLTAGCSCNSFPVLESLHLENLNCFEMIFDGPPEMMGSFGKLQILKVRDCGKLRSLFSFMNAGCFSQLQEMEVESCENMEALVTGGSEHIKFTCLRSLKLKNLPNLESFCNKKGRPEKIGLLFYDKVTFFRLTSLEVKNCKSLKYLFTRSNLKLLLQLERLEVNNCELVEEIIWHEESEEEGTDKVVLLGLKYVVLKKLKSLKRFSCGFPIEFTSLKKFSIHECPAMEYFVSEISEENATEGDEHHFGENVTSYNLDGKRFPQLMSLRIQNGYGIQHTINMNDLNSLESLHFGELRSMNASNCDKLNNIFSYSSAKCSTQLLEMIVQCCHNMEAIVGGTSEDEILEFTQCRSLKLENLPRLIGFCKQEEGIGQTELLFGKMVAFPNLTCLVVEKCNRLKYVFTTSMVSCLVHLKKLQISNCQLVEAIIQSNRTEENEINMIVFSKLDTLSLYGLPNVKMFGYGYEVEFPLLREFSLECPAMDNFVSKFSDRNSKYNVDEHLFSDLVTFSNLESLNVWNMNKIRYLWHDKFVLSKLKSLNIANCSSLSVVFPVDAYRRIPKLEALYLSCCDEVKDIFPLEETEWGETYIAEEFALQDVRIVNVASLKYVFPNIMAYSLLKLEQLEVHNCNIQLIIEEAKDEKSQGITCLEQTSRGENSVASKTYSASYWSKSSVLKQ